MKMWLDDAKSLTKLNRCEEIKRKARDRNAWRIKASERFTEGDKSITH